MLRRTSEEDDDVGRYSVPLTRVLRASALEAAALEAAALVLAPGRGEEEEGTASKRVDGDNGCDEGNERRNENGIGDERANE